MMWKKKIITETSKDGLTLRTDFFTTKELRQTPSSDVRLECGLES